jgi:hypothetical protein
MNILEGLNGGHGRVSVDRLPGDRAMRLALPMRWYIADPAFNPPPVRAALDYVFVSVDRPQARPTSDGSPFLIHTAHRAWWMVRAMPVPHK